ncbi:MAG: HAD-IA family hydrolase [Beijerinckiaceae bacterium]|nr:HAD-IA family hydrolase [Beijerinckiaceae bacterium]
MVQLASPSAPIVVFDLDGTLADTALDLIATLNVILEREGLEPLPLHEARDLIGAGARALIARGFAVRQKPLSTERQEQLFLDFLAHYGQHLVDHTKLYPGVVEALDALAADGYILAVCTNKVADHSRRLLDALGILDRFAALAGRDTYPVFKPDPRHLTLTIADAKGDPRRAVMIGDSKTDVDTARAADIPVIGVDFGYTEIPMQNLSPDRLISHFDALVPAVQTLIGR